MNKKIVEEISDKDIENLKTLRDMVFEFSRKIKDGLKRKQDEDRRNSIKKNKKKPTTKRLLKDLLEYLDD